MLILHGHTDLIRALKFSPEGDVLISMSDDHSARVWDVTSGDELGRWSGGRGPFPCMAVCPHTSLVAAGGQDRSLRIWDYRTRKDLHRFDTIDTPASVAWHPRELTLALGTERGRNQTLEIFQLADGEPVRTRHVHEHAVWGVAYSPDGEHLAIGFANGVTEVRTLSSWQLTAQFKATVAVREVAFSPDQRYLAVMAGRRVVLWNLHTREQHCILGNHEHYVWSIAFSPDGQTLATGSWDSVVRLWDVDSGQLSVQYDWDLGRINSVAISPDGMTAAAAGQREDVVIWDIDDFD